jgi:hypothetical protein
VRERGSAAAQRIWIGKLADAPGLVWVADLATRVAVSAPIEGRALYAGLRAPDEPVARLWHAETLLREHRGDSHNPVLVAHGIGGTEAHALLALSVGERALRDGGFVCDDRWLQGRVTQPTVRRSGPDAGRRRRHRPRSEVTARATTARPNRAKTISSGWKPIIASSAPSNTTRPAPATIDSSRACAPPRCSQTPVAT